MRFFCFLELRHCLQCLQAGVCSIACTSVPCGCCELRWPHSCALAAASLIIALVVVARFGASVPAHAAAAAAGPRVTALLVISLALVCGGGGAARRRPRLSAAPCAVGLELGAAVRMSRCAACRGWRWYCVAPRARQWRRAGGVVVHGGVGLACFGGCVALYFIICT